MRPGLLYVVAVTQSVTAVEFVLSPAQPIVRLRRLALCCSFPAHLPISHPPQGAPSKQCMVFMSCKPSSVFQLIKELMSFVVVKAKPSVLRSLDEIDTGATPKYEPIHLLNYPRLNTLNGSKS